MQVIAYCRSNKKVSKPLFYPIICLTSAYKQELFVIKRTAIIFCKQRGKRNNGTENYKTRCSGLLEEVTRNLLLGLLTKALKVLSPPLYSLVLTKA